jgi:hypothetical protein
MGGTGRILKTQASCLYTTMYVIIMVLMVMHNNLHLLCLRADAYH